jgi:hypothetical protein
MAHGAFEDAKSYITYRYRRSLVRQSNTTDEKILSLIECNNEEVKQENSNKNPVINSTQRDYMAGEVSRDITNRILLPKEIVDAHNEGWVESWRAHGWRRGRDELKNPDLWQRLYELTSVHKVTFIWVKGHNGHDYNERCDALATAYADSFL